MKKLIFPLLFFGFSCTVSVAQNAQKFWVQFDNKDNTPFQLSDPQQFLSQRAMDRRTNQGITLDEKDLPVDPSYVNQVAGLGASILNSSKWFNGVTIELQDSANISLVNQLPFVVSSTPANRLSGQRPVIDMKEEVWTPQQKNAYGGAPEDHGAGFNQIEMIGGLSLHDQGFMGQGMRIAVLDAGFINVDQLSVFDSLFNDNRLIATKDFVDGDDFVFEASTHGAHVLSTMASYFPGEFIGTAPKAEYMLLRSEEAAAESLIEEYNWVSAAEFADSAGADVINSSLGYTTFDNPTMDHTYADMDGNTTPITRGADLAASRGILVVNSAGNSGTSPWYYIGAPADGDSVFAIGAVDPDGVYAEFSSKGPSVDGRVKPNVVAQGAATVIANLNPQATEITQVGNGTSFSGPVIAGMVACLWQANPDQTNMQIIQAVEASASQANNPDEFLGYGIPNFTMANLITSGFVPQNIEVDELITAYPSPFFDKVQGAFYSAEHQNLIIQLVNPLGKVIRTSEVRTGNGCLNKFTFSGLINAAPGMYIVQVVGDSKHYKKIVKLD